jgi:hypothetical protein
VGGFMEEELILGQIGLIPWIEKVGWLEALI